MHLPGSDYSLVGCFNAVAKHGFYTITKNRQRFQKPLKATLASGSMDASCQQLFHKFHQNRFRNGTLRNATWHLYKPSSMPSPAGYDIQVLDPMT
jgi:hypothetical protein